MTIKDEYQATWKAGGIGGDTQKDGGTGWAQSMGEKDKSIKAPGTKKRGMENRWANKKTMRTLKKENEYRLTVRQHHPGTNG